MQGHITSSLVIGSGWGLVLRGWPFCKLGVLQSPQCWGIEACAIAVALTAFTTLVARAGQPAAYATAIMVAEGSMQRASDAWAIALAVTILGFVGEPIRRMRLIPTRRDQSRIEIQDRRVS